MSTLAKKVKDELKAMFNNSADCVTRELGPRVAVSYISGVADMVKLQKGILEPLAYGMENLTLQEIKDHLPIGEIEVADNLEDTVIRMLRGWVWIAVADEAGTKIEGLLCNVCNPPSREPNVSLVETHVLGPSISFTESLSINTGLVRSYITDPNLTNEELQIGEKTRTRISLIYINHTVDEEHLRIVRDRIKEIKVDGMYSSALLLTMLQDNKWTLFPLMTLTEKPDRTVQALLEGKTAILLDGDSQALLCPSTFADMFFSVEDRYSGWGIGLFLRSLRLFALFISLFFTPFYVAALTFHYEVIPTQLLLPLIESRSKVPFPPVIEAVLLEIIMELVREAGVRLPTKVGQTMGIVGGIVIGQAAVQAGFTSNILIMIVALAALGSFTVPNYLMSSSIRLFRFPMIIIASIWGFVGIVVVMVLFTIHLMKLTSLGKPYLFPLFPLRLKDILTDFLITPKSYHTSNNGFTKHKQSQEKRVFTRSVKPDIDE
ncbi:spore germination protein [Paenibacillus sp. 1001270B_150601_E10]|uniref:spore germination protein n=1 Tax=Paenibacillus sp. 1001270B_150601_E10 TaxID=2787079 RepID=UPI0018A02736|nr:spore germination protein [Paenibacillus sp. 1001270B_150601_E10]